MSSSDKNLDSHSNINLGHSEGKKIGLVVSEWNEEITSNLLHGAEEALLANGIIAEDITTAFVPGSFELILGSKWMAEDPEIDAVIALGSVIQGETKHFDFICQAVAQGIKDVNLSIGKPVVFGVLTTDTMEQAMDRAGGEHGNKGYEAGITALKMLGLKDKL